MMIAGIVPTSRIAVNASLETFVSLLSSNAPINVSAFLNLSSATDQTVILRISNLIICFLRLP